MDVAPRHRVRVCTGLSCRVTGPADHLRAFEDRLGIVCGQTAADGRLTLEDAPCLSVCSLAPVVEVDGVCHGRVTSAEIDHLPLWFRTRRPWPVDVCASDFPEVNAVGHTPRARLASLRSQAETRARRRPEFRFLVQGGSCGEALGADEMIRALRLLAAMRGLEAEVLDGACHGLCSWGLAVEVQRAGWPRLTFTHLTTNAVPGLLSAVAAEESPLARFEGVAWNVEGWRGFPPASRHPFFAGQRRRIMERCGHLHPVSLDDALLGDGYSALAHLLDCRTPEDVIEEAKTCAAAELRAAASKWEVCRAASARAPRYFVVNGEEGAPGLFIDRHLMEGDPHRVLEGLAIAAYAAGASHGVIHINGAAHLSLQRMTRAAAKAQVAGLVGDHILGSPFSFHVAIQQGARGFVRGEEEALVSSIESLRGTPTVVSNVAALAALPPAIATLDGGRVGQGLSATRLCTLSGPVDRPGIVEVEGSVTLHELLSGVAGGVRYGRHPTRALVVGPSGVALSPESLDVPLESLAAFSSGSGSVIAIPDGEGEGS
jgi:NADH:ubiquinone oxidoreductase subunit F (NADH-binding)